ncbi:MAG: flavin reductase family protein [Pseudomonadota bacterium]
MADEFRPLKDAFGRFGTGVTVVSCCDQDGAFVLMTVNSFTSVSLDPPLVLWCIERRASTFSSFMAAESYGVSILKAEQEDQSARFAGYAPDPLKAGEYDIWRTGAPILSSRLAGFDCIVVDRHLAGDHVILVGEVKQFDCTSGAPLLYFASQYVTGPNTA